MKNHLFGFLKAIILLIVLLVCIALFWLVTVLIQPADLQADFTETSETQQTINYVQ